MTEITQDLSLAQAHSLINSYDFDLGNEPAEKLLQHWLDIYHASWIRLATIEALYLGRYKAISIEHILNVWLRIGTPNTHFTYEFERLICRKLPKHLNDLSELVEGVESNIFSESSHDADKNLLSSTEIAPESTATASTTVDRSKLLNLATAWDNSQIERITDSPTNKPERENLPVIEALDFSCTTEWSEFPEKSRVISQFIPLPDVSSFFNRLKTFGEEKLEG